MGALGKVHRISIWNPGLERKEAWRRTCLLSTVHCRLCSFNSFCPLLYLRTWEPAMRRVVSLKEPGALLEIALTFSYISLEDLPALSWRGEGAYCSLSAELIFELTGNILVTCLVTLQVQAGPMLLWSEPLSLPLSHPWFCLGTGISSWPGLVARWQLAGSCHSAGIREGQQPVVITCDCNMKACGQEAGRTDRLFH